MSLTTFFNILYPICASLGIVTCIYKIRDLRKDPSNPALIALTLARLFPALSFTFATPAVYVAFDRAVGIDNIATLMVYGLIVCNSVTAQVLLLLWSYPAAVARTKALKRICLFAFALIPMIALFAVSDHSGEHPIDFDVTFATEPGIAAFLSIYLLAFGVGLGLSARMTWRFSGAVDRIWLRRGLRLNAAGALFGLGYAAAKATSVVARWFGSDSLNQLNILWAPISASIGAILIAVSSSLPAWGPRLEAWMRAWRQYHHLRPLWEAIRRVAPSIILDAGATRWRDRWDPRDLGHRLWRRVIEIRDGMLLLRDRLDRPAGRDARARAVADGVPEAEADAVETAAQLAAALQRSTSGESTRHHHDGATNAAPSRDAQDVDAEIEWLVTVAKALTMSPYLEASMHAQTRTETTR